MPKKFQRFYSTKKIRTISFDTNVLSDVPYYYSLEGKCRLAKKKKSYLERTSSSVLSIIVTLSLNIRPVGIELVRKELARKPLFADLYDRVFERKQINVNREIKWLAESYMKRINIDGPDALILAAASVGRIDLFLSWNRDDVVNEKNLVKIREINKKRNVHFPIFATPKEFLERIFLTDKKTIWLSQLPVPSQYRPRFFQTR